MKTNSRLAVYDGQRLVGEIEDRGRDLVIAFRVDYPHRRTKLGVYPTRIAAIRALARPAPTSSVLAT